MKFLRFCLIIAMTTALSCSSDDEGAGSSLTVQASDGTEQSLSSGETVALAPENREAVSIIVKGNLENGNRPYSTELVDVISGVYRDHDEGTGPEFWLMEASVEDADGSVLWSDRENSLFQLLEFLEIILSQTASINIPAAAVYNYVKQDYPELLNFSVRVPVGIEGADSYVLKMPDEDGDYYEVGRWKIADLLEQAREPALEGEVTTLVDSGPPEDNLDIVILGDGYQADNREKFDLDAQAVAEALTRAEPFRSHSESINIHTVWTPSVETGAGYDCTGNPFSDGQCKRDLRDTVFRTTFVVTAIGDLVNQDLGASDRVAMPLEVAKMYEYGALANADEIVLISNTRRASGFAGLYVSVVTTFDTNRQQFPNVAVHELGHSFGVLGDEYQAEGDACLFNEPRVPLPANIASEPTGNMFKWDRWFMGPTPIPTPAAEKDEYPIGAYLGAYNCDDLYRPAHSCKMNGDESDAFCAVCREQVTRRMYSVIDPLAHGTAEMTGTDSGIELSVGVHDPELFEVTWKNGETELGTGTSIVVSSDDLTGGDFNTITAEITETTGFIELDEPASRQTVEFQIKK